VARVEHVIRPNKRTEIPREFIFVDTETEKRYEDSDGWLETLRLGVACYVRRRDDREKDYEQWIYFRDPADFWNWVNSKALKKRKLWIFAHNMGGFDMQVLRGWEHLPRLGWEFKTLVLTAPPFFIECRKDDSTIVVCDTMNYIRTSLRQIGKAVGLEKLDTDPRTRNENELLTYCKRDVEILKRFVLSFVDFMKKYDLGTFRPTIAGCALNAFKHRFMKHTITVHNHSKVQELEEESYRGGRCECFYLGEITREKVYYLDVNSMYPFVMRENLYPVSLISYNDFNPGAYFDRDLRKWLMIADITFRIDKPAIGVKLKKLIFPVGTWRAVLCTPELRWIKENGVIEKIHRYAIYKGQPIFREYVNQLYALKEKFSREENEIWRLITKLFLNSLYGKFGQKNPVYELKQKIDDEIPFIFTYYSMEDGKHHYIIAKSGKLYEKTGEEPAFDSFTAIASHVTAYARMYLWELIEKAGMANCYYCDTDSLFVNEEGYENLASHIDGTELGKLGVKAVSQSVEILAPKVYRFGEIVRRKGVRRDAIKLGSNLFKQVQFIKPLKHLRGEPEAGARVEWQMKKLKLHYDKGEVLPNGRVRPWTTETVPIELLP